MSGLLDDLRVIDLSGEGGLFAGRFLAQLGADVIWVEPPDGSPVRAREAGTRAMTTRKRRWS